MKGSKVDVKNSEDTSGIAGAFALTANGRGEPTLPPVLRQILIGICIGMGILLIIITVTLGALLKTNVRYFSQCVSQTFFFFFFFSNFFFRLGGSFGSVSMCELYVTV